MEDTMEKDQFVLHIKCKFHLTIVQKSMDAFLTDFALRKLEENLVYTTAKVHGNVFPKAH